MKIQNVTNTINSISEKQQDNYIKIDLAIDFDTAKAEMTKLDQRVTDARVDLLAAQSKLEAAKALLTKIETDGIALKSQIDTAKRAMESSAAENSKLPKIAAAFKEEAAKLGDIWDQTTEIIITAKKLRGAKV